MSPRTPPRVAPKGCQHIGKCFEKQRRNLQLTPSKCVQCPVCNESMAQGMINVHLDGCLWNRRIENAALAKETQQSSLATVNKRKHISYSNGPKKKKPTIKRELITSNVIDSESDGEDFREKPPIKWKAKVKSEPNCSPGTSKQDEAPMEIPSNIPENLEKLIDVMKASTSNGASVSNNLGRWQSELSASSFSRSSSTLSTPSSCSTNIFDSSGFSSVEDCENEGSSVSNARLKRSLHFEENECAPVVASEFTRRLLTANKLPLCIAEMFYGEESEALNETESQRISQEPDNNDLSIAYSPSHIDNLLTVCKVVLDEPGNIELFNDEDMNWLKVFYSQSESAQKLYVRLFQRQFKWLPLKQLKEKKFFEDMELEAVLSELHSSKLLMSSEWLLDLETALNLLYVPTLKKLCKSNLKIDSNGNKLEIIKRVLEWVKRQRVLQFKKSSCEEIVLTQVKDGIGECYMLDAVPREVFRRILTLYNLVAVDDNDDSLESSPLTKLTLVNMGKVTYPSYVINIRRKIFRNRDDLLRFVDASSLVTEIALRMQEKLWPVALNLSDKALKQFRAILKNNDILSHDKSLPMFLRRFTAGHVLAKCLYYRVEALQRMKSYNSAVEQLDELLKQEIYGQSSRGRWYDRMSLNLDVHLNDKKEESLGTIIRGLFDASISSDYILALCKRGDKLAKAMKGHLKKRYREVRPKIRFAEHQRKTIVGKKAPSGIPGYKGAFFGKHGKFVSVEEYALEHYAELGYSEGIHGEGFTFVSIFGLLLWDVIYSVDIPDVFRTPHQDVPLDLHTDEFYANREKEIEARVAFISHASTEVLLNEIQDVWEKHNGEASIVSWKIFGELSKAQSLVRCMSNTFLARLCEKLSGEYRNCRGGVPDLVVWNPENFQWMMVEVKGPNDKLSVKQKMWLDFLVRQKVRAEELFVSDKVPKRLQKMQN